jgi:multiple sugar transport system permease protein
MIVGSASATNRAAFLFLMPSVVILFVFFLFPIASSFLMSLSDWDALQTLPTASFIGLENYRNLFQASELPRVLSHTLYYMVLYIPLVIITALAEANLLSKDFRGRKVYKVLFYLPVITSWVAGALIWRWVLNSRYGFLNQWLAAVGIQGPAWLNSQTWAMPGVVLAAVWKDTGYYALMFLAALKSINRNYYEAAAVDGASRVRTFFQITIPLMTPTIFFVVVINIINGFQVFESIWIMTQGGPAEATTVIAERIYRNAFTFYKMGYAAAYSWVLFAVILATTAVQLRLQKRWVSYES